MVVIAPTLLEATLQKRRMRLVKLKLDGLLPADTANNRFAGSKGPRVLRKRYARGEESTTVRPPVRA